MHEWSACFTASSQWYTSRTVRKIAIGDPTHDLPYRLCSGTYGSLNPVWTWVPRALCGIC